MEHIVLCPNVERDIGLACARRVKTMLEADGHAVVVSPIYGNGEGSGLACMPLDKALEGAKLLVSLSCGFKADSADALNFLFIIG